MVVTVLTTIENDGVIDESGSPHVLLPSLSDLLAASHDLRELAIQRRVATIDNERLIVERERLSVARGHQRVALSLPQYVDAHPARIAALAPEVAE
jgi:hypothetical protein